MAEPFRPGPLNLLTDVAGLRVGNAADARLRSGATVVIGETPFTAAVSVTGGAPGTRETDLLAPDRLVEKVDALVLSGGSAFGLDAATGVVEGLRAAGRGFAVGPHRVPIVPAAILFDLGSGGDQGWTENPWRALGRAAFDAATDGAFALGTAGAGAGARCGALKGGLGAASLVLPGGATVAALVAVNALGQATVGDGPHFWAAPFEIGDEFGGLGPAAAAPPLSATFDTKRGALAPGGATTIAVVATDAALDKAGASRLATAAQDGLARALVPAHTPFDGDLVFAAATGRCPRPDAAGLAALGHGAAVCLARAIARGVFLATPEPGDLAPAWAARFGR